MGDVCGLSGLFLTISVVISALAAQCLFDIHFLNAMNGPNPSGHKINIRFPLPGSIGSVSSIPFCTSHSPFPSSLSPRARFHSSP